MPFANAGIASTVKAMDASHVLRNMRRKDTSTASVHSDVTTALRTAATTTPPNARRRLQGLERGLNDNGRGVAMCDLRIQHRQCCPHDAHAQAKEDMTTDKGIEETSLEHASP